jgi:hypothetical protein
MKDSHRTGTACSPKGGLLCGVAVSFFVMVFVADTHCSTFIFLKDKKKNKRAASLHTEQKPTPKKRSEAK